MRKGILFKKGIIIALAATLITSSAPVLGASGWGVMNAKAEETTEITVAENAPQYLYVGDNSTIAVIWDGKLQDDGVTDNATTEYKGNNWRYDGIKNQLVLENASVQHITVEDGDLTVLLSGENTVSCNIASKSRNGEHTLELKSNNSGSLTVGTQIGDGTISDGSGKQMNLKITDATVHAPKISCEGSLKIENSHVIVSCEDSAHYAINSGCDISITNSYVEAKIEQARSFAISSDKEIVVSNSQIIACNSEGFEDEVIKGGSFSDAVVTKQYKNNETKSVVYGNASLREKLTIPNDGTIVFMQGASITNHELLAVEDGATILVNGYMIEDVEVNGETHTHNTGGSVTYIWRDDKEHTKGVACKDCPIGYVTKETESHNYNSQGFCTDCDAYQPAVLTTDKYDIDGDASKDKVYEIGNAGQLYWFAGLVNGTLSGVAQNVSANAVLINDITVNENVLVDGGLASDTSKFRFWVPIADEASLKLYKGKFDGQNYSINGLFGNDDESRYMALIGKTDENAVIKNIRIKDSWMHGIGMVAEICGHNRGIIDNCYAEGIVNAESGAIVGGICGSNVGTIKNCYNAAFVIAKSLVGGICGTNSISVRNCMNIGKVTASGDEQGQISGYNDKSATITNCYYLFDTEIDNKDGTVGKTKKQFATGEVTYLLQNGQSEGTWGQTIGTDTYPVLHGPKVYKSITYIGCNDSSDVASVSYSNEKKDVFGKHNFEDGICRYCGEKLVATVTKGDETLSCVSLPEAIGYAEKMPGSVVSVMEDTNTALDINNPDSDFTIDINGHKTDDIDVKNGKITIIDSKTGGDVKGHLDIKKDSTVTIGNVKISGTIHTMGQLILNGGDINKIILADETIKLYFNNSDIKINDGIYLYGMYGEKIIINAEPHNVIPIVLDGIGVQQGAAYAVAGDGIALKSDWFNASSDDSIIDLSTSIEDNKLRIGALLNDKVYAELDENKNIIYSGSELKPSVKVYYNWDNMFSVQLKEGSDYNVTYSDNINAGTATVTITGIGAYSGTKNVTFTIEPKKISSPTFDGLKSEYTYTGQKVEPEFALMDGDTVIPSSEYEVSYSDNTEVGTAAITITDVMGGNYDINCKAEFDIVKADPVISELPVADPISYDPHKTLNEASISGGVVIGVSGENITGTWSWADDSVVPSVDVTDYDVIFTPDDQKHYNSVRGTIQLNVSKADVEVVELPAASGITYGDNLAKAVISGGRVSFDGIDQVEIPGTFAWKDDSIKPFVSDSDNTLYTVVFTPADSVNYNTAEIEITVNVSKATMPNLLLSVDNTHKTVGSIALPGDWTWLDADTSTVIKAGGSVVATAVYAGDDKENYDSTELKVTIYRAPCSDGKTVKYTLKGEKAPTCTKAGTGHTECSICGDVMSTGVYVKELGHKWNSGRVTKKPTYTATGVKTFTCTVCKATKTGSIAKLATTDISKNTSKITVSGIENKIYNGKVHTQKSLVVKAGAKTLRLNKDYTVTYSKNKAVGKASVITRGKNAYSGKITKTFAIVNAAKGKTYSVGKFKYTITGAKTDGTGTVAIAGTTYSRSDKKFASLTIADTVIIGDVRFKITSVSANAFSRYTALKNATIGNNVTSIGSNAFLSCKNLKKMTIKSAKLKSVGAKAFSGTYSKITFAVPRNKATAYKKLIKKGSPSAKAIYK